MRLHGSALPISQGARGRPIARCQSRLPAVYWIRPDDQAGARLQPLRAFPLQLRGLGRIFQHVQKIPGNSVNTHSEPNNQAEHPRFAALRVDITPHRRSRSLTRGLRTWRPRSRSARCLSARRPCRTAPLRGMSARWTSGNSSALIAYSRERVAVREHNNWGPRLAENIR